MKSLKIRYIVSISLLLISVLVVLGATVGIGTSENSHFVNLMPAVSIFGWVMIVLSSLFLFSNISAHTENIENKTE